MIQMLQVNEPSIHWNLLIDTNELPEMGEVTRTSYQLLDHLVSVSIKKFVKETHLSAEAFLLSGLFILLSKYTRQEEISIGVSLEGILEEKVQDIPVHPVVGNVFEDKICMTFYEEIHKACIKSHDEKSAQMTEVCFMKAQQYREESLTGKLAIIMKEEREGIALIWHYDTTLFKEQVIKRLQRHYQKLLEEMINKASKSVQTLTMLTEEDSFQIKEHFNKTYKVDAEQTIIQRFEAEVEKNPKGVAAICEEETITYGRLNEKANQIAHYLRNQGLKPNDYVGLIMQRSIRVLEGIVGILKAGGAYVPIDPKYPEERIEFILKDCQAKLIVGDASLNHLKGPWEKVNLAEINISKEQWRDNLTIVNKLDDIAYLIYTSGTTGKPKGVMITQCNLCHVISVYQKWYRITSEDILLQFASISFDQSVWDIFGALLSGATVCIATDKYIGNMEALGAYINEKQVTFAGLTPTVINELDASSCRSLRLLESGGEQARLDVLKYWKNNRQVYNTYGPTECTINALSYEYKGTEKGRLPIGKPVGDTQIYILDSQGRLLPIGVPGELCIAGTCVAKGYLNHTELTEEKFISNPFGEGKLYRTGDLARWIDDGNVDYLGRIDEQVKIRGLRIELEEIEMVIRKYPFVQEAVVVVQKNKFDESYLCAYLVSEQPIDIDLLKIQLKENLPDYMIPNGILQIQYIPRNTNGKLDKRQLPPIPYVSSYVAPDNEIEEAICNLFSQVLGITRVGANDDFFRMGGHSLRATKVINAIKNKYEIDLDLKHIFTYPTAKGLSELIQNKHKQTLPKIAIDSLQKAPQLDYFLASSAQKRIYILTSLASKSVNYNMPEVFLLKGKLEIKRLEEAFRTIISRHVAFRTSFMMQEGEVIQKVPESVSFYLDYEEVEEDKLTRDIQSYIQPFDLTKPPLIRAKVYELEREKYVLLIDVHHIIVDGFSCSLVIEELGKCYNDEALQEVAFQYTDYSYWQQSEAYNDRLEKQEYYWLRHFSGEIPILEMPLDKNRPYKQSFEGNSHYLEVSHTLMNELDEFCEQNRITLNMVLLAAYAIVLAKYSGQDDLIIGMPIAGRDQVELQGIVGMFVNTLPIRLYPSGDKSFGQFLEETKQQLLEAYDNQNYPFDKLAAKLNLVKDASHNPIFDVAFVLQNTEEEHLSLEGLITTPYTIVNKASRFDLTLVTQPLSDKLIFEFNYCTDLYNEDTIRRLAASFQMVLETILEQSNILLKDIDAVSNRDKHYMMLFNNDYSVTRQSHLVHELFEEQVRLSPNQIAVQLEDKKLSYQELDEKANALACKLQGLGVKRNTIVGVFAETSLEMIISLFGILKAGGAYLPIDPIYPKERVSHILQDSDVTILLTQDKLKSVVDFKGMVIDIEDPLLYKKGDLLKKDNEPSDLAYVIYTSGSTGKPKGVMVAHENVVNTLLWRRAEYDFNSKDKVLQTFSVAFDGFVASFFSPIIAGAIAIFVTNNNSKDPSYLAKKIIQEHITHFVMVPALYKSILLSGHLNAYNNQLKVVCVAGDRLDVETVKLSERILPEVELTNEYGPTENTVASTILREVSSQRKITIGKPISNCHVYIVDKYLKLVPIGVKGEICVGGRGVAKGYLNHPELTKEKFIENPYCPGEELYHTGDLGRWLFNGEVDFIRRMDDQVQIRGYRVELGEIENTIVELEGIKECVVLPQIEGQNTQLYAYYVAYEPIEVRRLRKALKSKLPYYMVPSYFVNVPQMPLTPNGKIDEKALLNYQTSNGVATEVEKLSPMEMQLKTICKTSFSCPSIKKDEDFFEIGADSLSLITLQANLLKEGWDISIETLYAHRTLEDLANYIENHKLTLIHKEIEEVASTQEEESAVLLKVNMQRKMTTYLHRSLPMCIILAYEIYYGWYYSNFVQIFSYKNEKGYIELNYLEPYDNYVDVADVICLGYNLLSHEDNIITYIHENIDRGYYVILHLDEYDLPNKWAYKKEHFVHSSLIYGYDISKKLIYLISFDDQMTFKHLIYDEATIMKAYEAGKLYYKESAHWCEWSALQLIKPKTPKQAFPFSLRRFKEKLSDYIEGYSDGYTLYNLGLPVKFVAYGTKVYDVMLEGLENTLEENICIDYRAIHLIYEHKVGLLERFSYIGEHYHVTLEFTDTYEAYKGLVQAFNVVRLKFKALQDLDIPLDKGQKETILDTINELKQMSKKEETLLRKLLTYTSDVKSTD